MTSSTRYKLSFTLCLSVIIGSLIQISLGAEYSATGEQLAGGVPVSSLILFICGLTLFALDYKKADFFGFNIFQVVLITALAGSLLGLSGVSVKQSLKELIQIYEIFVFSYLLFLYNRHLLLDVLKKSSAFIVIFLLLMHLLNLNTHFPFYLSDTKLEAFIVLLTPFVILNTNNFSFLRRFILLAGISVLCGFSFSNGGLLLSYLMIFILSGLLLSETKNLVTALAIPTLICSFIQFNSKTAWDSLAPGYNETYTKRLYIEYKASLKAPANFPLGIGPGSYKKGINYLKKFQPSVPHEADMKIPKDSNSQYQIYLVESGIFSLLSFLAYLLYLFVVSLKTENRNDRYLSLILVSALGVTALFCVVFSRGIGIFAGGLLAVVSSRRFSENEKSLYPAIIVFASLMFLIIFLIAGTRFDNPHHQSPYNLFLLREITNMPMDQKLKTIVLNKSADQKTTIIIEAENALDLQPNFIVVPANDSSGDHVIEIPKDSGKGIGTAEYELDIPESGMYKLFARVWWEDGCSNSIAVEIGNLPRIVLSNELFKKWQLIESVVPIALDKGKCRLKIINLEDGVKIDFLGLVPVARNQ